MLCKQELTSDNWCFTGDSGFPGLPGKTDNKCVFPSIPTELTNSQPVPPPLTSCF